MSKRLLKYDERASNLLRAMEIADAVVQEMPDPTLTMEQRKLDADHYALFREFVRNPEPQFRNCKSLKYLEDEFFIYWNESDGRDVEEFWRRIARAGLPFVRKDHLREILNNRRIRSRAQYEAVQDGLVIWEQEGRISSEDAHLLSAYIGDYERRQVSPRRRRRSARS